MWTTFYQVIRGYVGVVRIDLIKKYVSLVIHLINHSYIIRFTIYY